jgi:putative ABC transport system permease protein
VDPRSHRPNWLTAVTLAISYLRSKLGRTSVLGAGFGAVGVAFAVLAMNAAAPIVQFGGRLPAASPSPDYDILVGPAGQGAPIGPTPAMTRPADLAAMTGGITLQQYRVISRLAGVQVAAPMTMVGYVPLTVTFPVAVPAAAITALPRLFAVTAMRRSDGGLSTVTELNLGSTYVTANPLLRSYGHGWSGRGELEVAPGGARALVCPDQTARTRPPVWSVAAHRQTECWSTSTGPGPHAWAGPPPAAVSVPVGWAFLLPLVAVDPVAEARLLHLNNAVISGRYLPVTGAAPTDPVPMIVASSIGEDDQERLTISMLPGWAARSYAGGLTAPQINALLERTAGRTIGTAMLTAAGAYRRLLGHLASAEVTVPAYWTTSPASFAESANGDIAPRPVSANRAAVWGGPYSRTGVVASADVQDVGFRSVTPHVARMSGRGRQPSAGAVLRAVGVFDPDRVASSPATPSPYRSVQLSAADARSRKLLGGRPLTLNDNPAGYPDPVATLVMPLQDIGAFTAPGVYGDTDSATPIGSVRVRVAGVTGDDPLSLARVRAVAQEIVRATGLHVTITVAATLISRTIYLAAGRLGRPALRLSEAWYRSDTQATVAIGLDPRRIALSILVLPIGVAFFVNGVSATLRARRRDLATLRALGWRRRRVSQQLLQEFALIAIGGWLVAAVTVITVGVTLSARLTSWWPLLGTVAALLAALAAIWWPVRQATADAEMAQAVAARLRAARLRRALRPMLIQSVRNLRRAPMRTALAVLLIATGCAALGQELAVHWVFHGVLAGSVLGRTVVWQSDPADTVAVITVLIVATLAVTDVHWLNIGKRMLELRTLHAIGWPAEGVVRLVAYDALLVGAVGGLAGGVADLAASMAIAHDLPASLLLVAVAVTGAGIVISLVAAGLSAVGRLRLPDQDGSRTHPSSGLQSGRATVCPGQAAHTTVHPCFPIVSSKTRSGVIQ